jgi:hypothetical protein
VTGHRFVATERGAVATAEAPHRAPQVPLGDRDNGQLPLSRPKETLRQPIWRHGVALASLQLIVGYQLWASGVDKLLYARFPQTVGALLASTLQGSHIPAPVAALLRTLVLPNSVLFGYLVEWGEMLAGLGLIAGAVIALVSPLVERRLAPELARWIGRGRRLVAWLALGAAAGGALMGLSFYFIDGAPSQWVMPSVAYGGVLDPGLMVLLGCVALLADAAFAWRRRHARMEAARAAAVGAVAGAVAARHAR